MTLLAGDEQEPVVRTGMLIRRPVREVFDAFIDPSVTTKFWFTKSSGKLEAGKRVRWEWEMYGVGTDVDVLEVERDRRISIRWSPPDWTSVEWTFTPVGDDSTYVNIINAGFKGDGDDVVAEAIDSMGGFTMVLCALKAWLEHNVILSVVADKAAPHSD
ncbi:SRPBCC family protein [Paenibacillus cisolokensis]|nr:SRPBCC family protein [Paenibacillus cisolokensis]